MSGCPGSGARRDVYAMVRVSDWAAWSSVERLTMRLATAELFARK